MALFIWRIKRYIGCSQSKERFNNLLYSVHESKPFEGHEGRVWHRYIFIAELSMGLSSTPTIVRYRSVISTTPNTEQRASL